MLCLPILDCKTRVSWDWYDLLICWDLPLELKRRLAHGKLLGRLLHRQLLGGLLHEWLVRLLECSCRRGPMLIDRLRELLGHLSMLLGLLLRCFRLLVRVLSLPVWLDSDEDFGIPFIVTGPKLNTSGRWVAHEVGTKDSQGVRQLISNSSCFNERAGRRDNYSMNAPCCRTSRITFTPENSSINNAPEDGDVVVIRFALLNLLSDELSPFAVLGANCLENFDEIVARSDSIRDDCTERDWDHVGENSECSVFGCLLPTSATK